MTKSFDSVIKIKESGDESNVFEISIPEFDLIIPELEWCLPVIEFELPEIKFELLTIDPTITW